MFCVACKRKTENKGEIERVKTKNGRLMIKCKCSKCDKRKCQFVSAVKGGLINRPNQSPNNLDPNDILGVFRAWRRFLARDEEFWSTLYDAGYFDNGLTNIMVRDYGEREELLREDPELSQAVARIVEEWYRNNGYEMP